MIQVLLWALTLIVVPAVLSGLAVGRHSGLSGSATAALMVPLGLALVVFAVEVVDYFGGRGWAFASATICLAVLGGVDLFGTAAGRLFVRANLAQIASPIAACGGSFALLALPWRHVPARGVLGYSQLNDQVVHGLVAEWISNGRPAVAGDGWDFALAQPRAGYPVGSHELLAVMLAPVSDIQRAYSPTLALLVAFSACPAYWLIRRSGSSNVLAIIGAGAAGGSFLQLGYTSQGYLPSMASTAFVLTAIALIVEVSECPRFGAGALAGCVIGASAAVYSLSVAVYFIAPALIGLVIAATRAARSRVKARWWELCSAVLGLSAGTGIVLLPVAASSWRYFSSVYHPGRAPADQLGGATDLGNLFHPLPFETMFGSWISSDYRLDYEHGGRSILGASISGGMTRLGLFAGVCLIISAFICSRRVLGVMLLALSGPVLAVLYIRATQGPYYVAKSYQMASVFLIANVFVGAGRVSRLRWVHRRLAFPENYARATAGLLLVLIWGMSALASDLKEASSASVPPPLIRTDLPSAAAAARRADLAPVVIADTSVWSYLAAPTGLPVVLNAQGPPGGIPDSDSIMAYAPATGALIVTAVGGLSLPPPPFAQAATFNTVRLFTIPRGSTPPAPTLRAESGKQVGADRVPPGQVRSFAVGGSRRVLVGVLDPDSQYVPFLDFHVTRNAWSPWEANPDMVVPTGAAGGALTYTLDIQRGGSFRVALIGLFFDARLAIDGRVTVISGGQIRSPVLGPVVSLGAGAHTIELRSSLHGSVSYAQAFSVERVGSTPPASYLCVQGKRFTVFPGRPALVTPATTNLRIENCGHATIALDWVEPL